MRTLWPTWRMSWSSISAPMIYGTRWSTWMKSLCSYIKETRAPLPAQPGKPLRYDYEYERVGTANVFLLPSP